jgi:hypothetical protein
VNTPTPRIIDLSKARSSADVDVLAGRDKGEYWRDKFDIETLDKTEGEVHVRVPENLSTLSLSFFLNLFGKSVRMFGREGFLQKYLFEGNDAVLPQIEIGIKQALKKNIGIPRAS